MRAKLSVLPLTSCPSLGYLNWKLYLVLVKVNQSLTFTVGVAVAVGPPGIGVGVCEGVAVAVDPLGVEVGVSEAGGGVEVCVAVGVGDPGGVGVDVGVRPLPRTVRLVGMNPIAVSTLFPVETRALHSNVV